MFTSFLTFSEDYPFSTLQSAWNQCSLQLSMERKLSLFGHIGRMEDSRLVKCVVFGIMDGQIRRGRPSKVVGRHQGMVPDRHPHSQQEGTGPGTVEIDRQTSTGHQRM